MMAQWLKNPPAVQETQETWVWSLGQDDTLEKEMATHSSILAWEIPWTEETGGLQSKGWQRVGHDLATKHSTQVLRSMNLSCYKLLVKTYIPFCCMLFMTVMKLSFAIRHSSISIIISLRATAGMFLWSCVLIPYGFQKVVLFLVGLSTISIDILTEISHARKSVALINFPED